MSARTPTQPASPKVFETVKTNLEKQLRAQLDSLRESEARYRLIVETAHEGIWQIDTRGRTTYVNRAMAGMLGYAPKEMQGRSLLMFMDTTARRQAQHLLRERRQGVAAQHDFRFRRKDGRDLWAIVTTNPLQDSRGKFSGALALVTDITDRRQADESLKASELKYRIVADNTYDWEFWSAPDGRVLYCSPSCARITGHTAAEFMADPRLRRRLIHPDDRARFDRHVCQAEQRRKAGEDEWRVRGADGTYRWVAHACQPVFGEGGQYLGVRASNREITDRKRAEDALRDLNTTLEAQVELRTAALQESEERFRQMAENVREVFWLADRDFKRMQYVSPAYAAIWGQSCQSLYRNPRAWAAAIHPEDRERAHRAFFDMRRYNRVLEAEYRIVRPDGTIRWISDRGWPVRGSQGRVYRFAGLARDVTEEKRLQAEIERVSEMERQRLGRDLHDGLSQHLAAMSMLGDSLAHTLQTKLPDEAKQAARLAHDARDAMVVAHDLARALYPTSLQMSGLPTALKELALLAGKMFPIRCHCRNGNGYRLADSNLERQLFRIAQEAVFNAAKHSRGRNIWMTLQQSKKWLTLTVRDDGIGVSEKSLESSDMGLNIMRYRANLIGAMLTFDARRGHGTTVICKLRNHKL